MEKCEFPRCRRYAEVGYIGRGICIDHWTQLCGSDGKAEQKLLKKIGLVRNKMGAVVQITPTKK